LEKKEFPLGKKADTQADMEFYMSNTKDAAELTDNTEQLEMVPGVPGTTHKNLNIGKMAATVSYVSGSKVKKKVENAAD
jgi:hypothetical protein